MNHYTYKLRLYPNELQKQKLANHFGSCRYIYNHFLNERKETYLNEKKSLNYYDQAAKLTKLKEKLDWLYETNSQALQFELKCLEAAYNNFFKHKKKFPKFHSKHDKQNFTIPEKIKINDNKLYFFKFKEGIKIKLHREIQGKIKKATVSMNQTGQYYVCILTEREIQKLKPSSTFLDKISNALFNEKNNC